MSDPQLQDAIRKLREIQWRQEAERRRARFRPDGSLKPCTSRNRMIADRAIHCQRLDGDVEFWVTYNGSRDEFLRLKADPRMSEFSKTVCDADALNGYVAFPKRRAPHIPPGTGSLTSYIPVHGGVTYASKDSFAAVWGFDTMHSGSEHEPRGDKDWILANCVILYRGLLLAAKLWPEFRRAGRDRRMVLAQQLLDLIPEQPLMEKLGFEALINLMCGKVE